VDGGDASTPEVCALFDPIVSIDDAHTPGNNSTEITQSGGNMKLQKLTPNLVVRDVAASMEFYCGVLGFERGQTVPEQAPYVFGIVTQGAVEIFFNDQKAVAADHPALGQRPVGGALTLYIEVQEIEELFRNVQQRGVKITMPMKEQFYGMKEFGMEDPEGWEITFAERMA
jgi:uncharacterized glyoxalase superfamily protein PhnB